MLWVTRKGQGQGHQVPSRRPFWAVKVATTEPSEVCQPPGPPPPAHVRRRGFLWLPVPAR